MAKSNPNALIQQRWREGQRVVQKQEGRKLTQREFLDVAFGNNPRTGKPYNSRTLRKWLNNERNAASAVEHSKRDTYSFQQRVTINDQDYGPVLTKPSGASGLDLFTPTGRRRVKRAARQRLNQRIDERRTGTATTYDGQPKEYRPVVSTRGLKVSKARAIGKTRVSAIITRKAA
jgi:hypothetical protein